MNYTQFQSYIETLAVDQLPSANFVTIFPAAIQDAEERIYRECDFLATRTPDATATFTAGSRTLILTTNILLFQGVAAVSPGGSAPNVGTRNQLEIVSLDFIDTTYPTESFTSLPLYVAPLTVSQTGAMSIVVAPTPDANYVAEVTGIFRPAALSATNTSTYLSATYPDLLIAATMVFMTGYQRDFGQQSDNPQMAMSWEALYQSRKESTFAEEQRRKSYSEGWSSFQNVAPQTQPKRT